MKENRPKYILNGEQDDKTIKINNKDNFGDIKRPDEKDKRVHYALLKVLGIVGLGVVTAAAVGAGVGLALGGFGISMGIPLVGSALVTAGSWLATAIPALGAFGVALPIAIGAIVGLGIAALAIFGIYKLIKSFGNGRYKRKPLEVTNTQTEGLNSRIEISKNLELNKNNKGEKDKNKAKIGKKSKNEPKIKRETLEDIKNGNDNSSDSINIDSLKNQLNENKIKIIDMKPIDNNKNKIELGGKDGSKLEKENEETEENKKEPEIEIKEEIKEENKEKKEENPENNIEEPDKKLEEMVLKEKENIIIEKSGPKKDDQSKEDEKPKEEESQGEIKE